MSAEYSEDKLVQQTIADYFVQTLHWESVFAYNTETLGTNGTLGRNSQTEIILKRYLHQALETLNPGHPPQAYTDALDQLTTFSATKTLLQINQDCYKLLRDGVRVTYRNPQDETVEPRLRVIDFDNPQANHFLIVRELWIQGPIYRKRPDIIGFINGLPILFIELKRTDKDIRLAYNKNLTDYKAVIPELFYYNAFVMLSNGIEAKVGTLSSPYDFFHDWKRLQEDETGRVDFETMLLGICPKPNILDLLENFILFDNSSQATLKILARNHQYIGVNHAFTAIQQRDVRDGKLGVFWHTQGSGKSYSMSFLSEKAHRKLPENFTFLIVTDRDELDTQIVQTFAGIGAVPDDTTQATSGDDLIVLLKQNHRYVFTLIHKFNKPGQKYSDRSDIIVICDEAHRTQYGKLAETMRLGLRNASFIAFTGTPLMETAEDQKTRDVFGDYVSTYNFKRSVEDGSTVPLYYDNRGESLTYRDNGQDIAVSGTDALNQRIAEALTQAGLNEEEEERILRRLGNDSLVLTAEPRLDRIAQDLVAHYTSRWQTGKAMLVCLDKLTVVKMHGLIDKYWKQVIAAQVQRIHHATDEQDLIEQQRYHSWLTATQYRVVISEAQNEVQTFADWGLDIRPHRQIMKTQDLQEDFKKADHPFRLAIVCAMWLTGFDVPSLSTLYMDKPMKGHTLMQTIARANRVADGKNNGLLVDYNGILKSLRAALSKYADPTVETHLGIAIDEGNIPFQGLEKLRDDYAQAVQACLDHVANLGFDLQTLIDAQGFDKFALLDKNNANSALNAVCVTDEAKAQFNVLARNMFQKKAAFTSDHQLTGPYYQLIAPYRSQHDAIEAIYNQLHQQQELSKNLNDVLRSLHILVSNSITVDIQRPAGAESERIYDISAIDWDLLKAEFTKSQTKNVEVQTLKQAIEQQLQRMIRKNPTRIDLYQRYLDIMLDYNRETDRITIEQTFEELLRLVQDISEEDGRTVRESLSEEQLAIFDLLCKQKNDLSPTVRERVKAVAQNLLEALKTELQRLDNWRDKEITKAQIKTFIHDYLYNDTTGLPEDYEISEVETLSNVVFLHIYRPSEAA